MTAPSNDEGRLGDFANAYAAAWCSQEAARVASFFDELGSLSVNEGAPAVGRSAIAAVAPGFMTAFPDMQVFCDALRFENGTPVFHWTLVGTNDGPGGSGRSVRISGYEEWQMGENGLILSSRGHFDSADYERQTAPIAP